MMNRPLDSSTYLLQIVSNGILVVLTVAAFRKLHNPWPAVLAITVVWTAVSPFLRVSVLARWDAHFFSFLRQALWDEARFFDSFWVFLSFLGMILALRWCRYTWVALFAGNGLGLLADHLFHQLLIEHQLGDLSTVYYIPLDSAILATVLWGGVRLTSGTNSSTEQPVNKGVYVSGVGETWIGGTSLFLVFLATGAHSWGWGGNTRALVILASLLVLAGSVSFCVLLYKAWAAIQDGKAHTTPGAAVGFCFVPFFNIYWGFRALWGFAKDYNQFIARHGVHAPELSPGLFATYCILVWLAWIPFLGVLVCLANVVILSVIVSRTCDAVNRLPRSRTAAPVT